MAAKYQQYFQDMLENNQDLFDSFKIVHDKYAENPEKYQEEFNIEGEKVMAVIRRVDNQLCNQSEGGKYGKYATNLSDKFWAQVRTQFPKIDFVGTEYL